MNIDPWFEFGFAGAVTGSLFLVTFFVVRWALKFADRLHLEHKTEREEWRQEQYQSRQDHSSERSEWRQEFSKIALSHEEKLQAVCETLRQNLSAIAERDSK